MKRRKFLRNAAATALSASVMDRAFGMGVLSAEQLDLYGGWTGKKFKATGFFRVEKDQRWWLVTPEGNAFLSFGINHLHSGWWKEDYNRAVWMKRFGVNDSEGPEFSAALRSWFLEVCGEYGFNTAGVHTTLPVINNPKPAVPYMQPIRFVDIPHWKSEIPDENFLDVFSPEFAQHCDEMAREIALPVKDDPFLLGYSMTDCPLFTEEDCRERPDVIGGARRKSRIGWPRRLRNFGSNVPGKQAYVNLMGEIYRGNIDDFNGVYGTSFDSFDALASAQQWRPQTDLSNANETRDNVEFLKKVVEKYYQTALDSIRRYDSNHLFVGDKINANTDTLDTVLPVTNRFTDIIFYQMYGRYEVQEPGLDRWSKMTDKPFINGDSAYTMITENQPRPYGPVSDRIEQRAEWTEEFFRKAFPRPEFVGWHYCGLIDASNLMPSRQGRQHSGMMDGYGKPYPLLREVLKACSDEKYEVAMERM